MSLRSADKPVEKRELILPGVIITIFYIFFYRPGQKVALPIVLVTKRNKLMQTFHLFSLHLTVKTYQEYVKLPEENKLVEKIAFRHLSNLIIVLSTDHSMLCQSSFYKIKGEFGHF